MAIITSTPADFNSPPVSLDDVKETIGVTYAQDDNRLLRLIWGVIDDLEQSTGRSWATQQSYKWTIDRFPPIMPTYNDWLRSFAQSPLLQYGVWIPMRQRFYLPRNPAISVDSIQYWSNGTQHTLDPSQYYFVPSDIEWATVEAVTNFPVTDIRPDAVQITFTSGSVQFPFLFNSLVCEFVAWKNENREGGDIPASITRAINLLKDGTYT